MFSAFLKCLGSKQSTRLKGYEIVLCAFDRAGQASLLILDNELKNLA